MARTLINVLSGLAAVSVALIAPAILGGCAADPAADGPPTPPPPRTFELTSFSPATRTDVLIGGQPSGAAIEAFAARGGDTVINLRTPEEMEALPDYAGAVRAEGLRYVSLPVKGSTMGAAHYESVKAALDEARGPVLLHCASGGRATYLWAMHMIDDRGVSADDAVRWCHLRRGKPWEEGDAMLRTFASSSSSGIGDGEGAGDAE